VKAQLSSPKGFVSERCVTEGLSAFPERVLHILLDDAIEACR
jgi:hypothetical protein